MGRKPTGKPGGRPRIPIITPDLDEKGLAKKLPPKEIVLEEVLYWMDLGATAEEIAGACRVGVTTLDVRLREMTGMGFRELKERTCGTMKLELRRNQFNLSKTNSALAIWLGKVWLGQKDNEALDQANADTIKNFATILEQLKNLRENQEPPAPQDSNV